MSDEQQFDFKAFRFFIDNPSAWRCGFDQDISDAMKCAADEIERLRPRPTRAPSDNSDPCDNEIWSNRGHKFPRQWLW